MADTLAKFDLIMAPLGGQLFLEDYLGWQPPHLEGSADKWQSIIDWAARAAPCGAERSHGSRARGFAPGDRDTDRQFSKQELADAFPTHGVDTVERFLAESTRMGIIGAEP